MASSAAEKLCRRFSLAEIQSATGDFSDDYVIGKGGFGEVYKGFIDNGSVLVAIKRRLASNRDQGQGRTEFAAEIEILSKFRHFNLVALIGYCDEEGEMILVYDYMSNGTLADHLYNLGTSLSWSERLKICIGAGRGLDYLHSGCSIIHRDVKPTNILLDDDFTAKVSDFGLAKHLGHNMSQTHVTTHVKGSFGYFDPSYFTTGRLTKGSDTYAFGVILLEVLSGRPAVEKRLDEDQPCMSMWAQEKIRNGKAEQIVNPYLKGDISETCLKTFVGVVKRCLHHDPKKRLTMSRVVAQLELALEQQEGKGTGTRKLQFWPFRNRVIPFGSTQKDVNEVKVDVHVPASPLAETNDITDDSSVIPFGSTSKDENEIEVDTLSKAIRVDHTINMLPIYVPSIPLENPSCSNSLHRGKSVFYGLMQSGEEEATIQIPSRMPKDKFIALVSTVSSLKHENVVQLVGYYMDDDGLGCLVYEPAQRESLYDILYDGSEAKASRALSWSQRMKIAVGAARGLHYIHHNGLIHHHITSRNVLLFDDETAKITELHSPTRCFYCNAMSSVDECHSNVKRYYDAPEWTKHTQKSNVYSFGVILLELLTGGPKRHPRQLVSRLGSGRVHKIVDAGLQGDYPEKAVEKMAKVAQICLSHEVECRPNMSMVVRALELCDTSEPLVGLPTEARPCLRLVQQLNRDAAATSTKMVMSKMR